jgi:all-trans-retinol 13,14-reductase
MVSKIATEGCFDVATPCTWQAPALPAKAPCDFDAIIVGSGIGGLTCASLLAKLSFKVLVLEKHFQVGGFCSSFNRRSFTFTSGVEDISSVQEGSIRKFLKMLDFKKEDLFVLNRRLFVIGDKRITLDGTKEGTVSGLSAAFPEEASAIRTFLDEVDSVLPCSKRHE